MLYAIARGQIINKLVLSHLEEDSIVFLRKIITLHLTTVQPLHSAHLPECLNYCHTHTKHTMRTHNLCIITFQLGALFNSRVLDETFLGCSEDITLSPSFT